MAKRVRNYDYFAAFERMGDFSCAAADMLSDILEHFDPAELPRRLREMHEIEHDADLLQHEMHTRLAKEFITPIEREDIFTMAQALDEVTDCIEDVALRMYMLNAQDVPDDAKKMTNIVVRCCAALKKALREFSNFKKSTVIDGLLVEINDLEEAGDELYIEANHQLYSQCQDALRVYTWASTFTRLEKCCDACEGVASTMDLIIMKNT